jgi:hypothetical protein
MGIHGWMMSCYPLVALLLPSTCYHVSRGMLILGVREPPSGGDAGVRSEAW